MSSAMRDEVLAAISKFENDLGFVAPELISEKFDLLRSRVSEILEDAEDAGEPAGAPSSFTEWAAFWGGGHPDDCAGLLVYDDEAEAEEMAQVITGAGVTKRTVTRGPWTVTQAPAEWDDRAEDEHRGADLRAHVSGRGGPSPAYVSDDNAGAFPDRGAAENAL